MGTGALTRPETGATVDRPRGWYHGWNVVLATILSQVAANGLGINAISLFLHDWVRELHSPASQLLLAIPPLGAVVALCSPLMGSLADRYPARRLFGLGITGIGLFSLAMSAVTATWQIWLLYATLFPVSITLCTAIVSNALVSRWFSRRVGLALGISAIGVGMSGVILPPLITLVMPLIGWRSVWRIAGAVTLLVILPLVVWIVRDRPRGGEGGTEIAAPTADSTAGRHGGSELRWADILTRVNFWLLVACFVPILSLYFGAQQNLAPIAASHGFDAHTAGLLLAVFALLHVIATPVLGYLSDRIGNRVLLVMLALSAALGAGLVGYGDGLAALFVGVALIGLSGGLWNVAAAAIVLEFGAEGTGRAFGALMLCLPINAAAAAVIARTQESTGSYGPALLGLGLLCLLGSLCALRMREKPARERAV